MSVAAQVGALSADDAKKAFRKLVSVANDGRSQLHRVINPLPSGVIRWTAVIIAATVVAGAAPVTPHSPSGAPEHLWNIANSAIFISVISTFIAAFAGTWGAQLLAERTARRKELLHEIRGINSAISFAFNIANTYIATKEQHIREILVQYNKQVLARQAHSAGLKDGAISANAPFKFDLVLKTISPPFSPIEGLQKTLFDRISPDGRALILLTPLIQCIQGFADVAVQRNAWISEIKDLPEDADVRKACLYFGTPYAPGRVDDRYPNLMKAIERYTDDCIAFSILMMDSLTEYGDRIAAKYGRGAPKIVKPDFRKAGDLIPDMKHYADWTGN